MSYQRRKRLVTTFDVDIEELVGVEAVKFRFTLEDNDEDVEIISDVETGSFGIRLDGDGADRETITPADLSTIIDVEVSGANNARGIRTLSLFARSPLSRIGYFEMYVFQK